MTETSCPQESDNRLPPATACSMPQQPEPSTGYVPGGHPGTTIGHSPPDWRHGGPGPGDHAPPAPLTTATEEHGSLRRRGTEGALRHPRNRTLERASGSPPGPPPERQPEQALRRGPPAAPRNNRNLCAAAPSASHPRDTDHRRFNTHQQDQGGIWVPHLGWAQTLIAPPTDPRSALSTGGPGTGRPATESPNPPHPTVRGPGGMEKQDSPRQGA